MPVIVAPESFVMVEYDQPTITAEAERIVALLGIASSDDIRIEVDEATPFGRTAVVSVDPVVLAIEGGAFEDPRHPRKLGMPQVASTLGQLLVHVYDRRDPSFGDPPADDDLNLAHRVAWDVYAMGRLDRLGIDGQRQRRLYAFRNRVGFTDVADEAFTRLWTGTDLTWEAITSLADDAAAARLA